jgi:hypothetical protein
MIHRPINLHKRNTRGRIVGYVETTRPKIENISSVPPAYQVPDPNNTPPVQDPVQETQGYEQPYEYHNDTNDTSSQRSASPLLDLDSFDTDDDQPNSNSNSNSNSKSKSKSKPKLKLKLKPKHVITVESNDEHEFLSHDIDPPYHEKKNLDPPPRHQTEVDYSTNNTTKWVVPDY